MHHCGWLVGVLATLLLVAPSTSSTGESGPSNPEMEAGTRPASKLEATCYFGSPSESCTFACSQKSMDAYCDDVKKQCACKESENKEVPAEESESESDETEEESSEEDKQPTIHVSEKQPQKTNFRLRDFCVFGHPSPACKYYCSEMSLESYCDGDQGICQCRRPPENNGFKMDWFKLVTSLMGSDSVESSEESHETVLGQITGSTSGINSGLLNLWQQMQSGLLEDSEESEENSSEEESSEEEDARHYVFYVFDLDSLFNETETLPSPNTTEIPSAHPVLHKIVKSIEGWAFSHILAVILIVFLFGILMLELAFCIKKEKTEDQMQTIFPAKKN